MKRNSPNTKLSFKKHLALSLFTQYRKNKTALHELSYLFWECTLRCNLNCIHCGSDCTKESNVPDMQLNDFLQVLDEVKNFVKASQTMVALTGGEPLMREDLAECGSEIAKRGFPWGMVTNGYMLSEGLLTTLLESGLKSITISLDGLKESHDLLRNKSGSFEKAYKAIQIVASVPGLVYDVATCVHEGNISELEELYFKLVDAGVKNWRLFTIFPRGRAEANIQLKPTNDVLNTLFTFIKDKRKEDMMHVSYGCEGFLGNWEAVVRDSFFFCRAGINIGSVLADGSVSACPSLRSEFIQGNIYFEKFSDIWENQFKVMRDRGWTKNGICEKCNSYKWCCGNGLHLRNEKDGSLLFCHLNELNNKRHK